MNRVCVVIPARNEEQSIGALVAQALQYVDEVIVVDDGSTDDTFCTARAAGATVISSEPSRRGLSDVYRQGLMHAVIDTEADWVIEMDAGFGHDPHQLQRFTWMLRAGCEVVFGERYSACAKYDAPWQRRLLSWLGTRVTNWRHGTAFKDATSGFIGYTRRAVFILHGRPFRAAGHYYQTEVRRRVIDSALGWCEVPISFRTSKSSLRWSAVFEAIRLAFR